MTSKVEPMQAMIDGFNMAMQRERARSQMTLGKLIKRLSDMPASVMVDGIGRPHSYRGYYQDLAFQPLPVQVTAAELLNTCRDCMGKVFEGYKGGEFQMGELTPVWIAHYGCCKEQPYRPELPGLDTESAQTSSTTVQERRGSR